jgi:hypothetical protein
MEQEGEVVDGDAEVVVTPAVAAEDEAAKFEVRRLLAEMEAMDHEAARLRAILEIQQMDAMRASIAEVANNEAALAAVRRVMDSIEGDDAALAAVRRAMASAAPPTIYDLEPVTAPSAESESSGVRAQTAEPPVPRPPRQSALSAEGEAKLAALLSEDSEAERTTRERLRQAQTTTLRRMMGAQEAEAGAGVTSVDLLPQLAAVAQAQAAFAPDESEMASSLERMEEQLRALKLQRDMAEQQAELRRLKAELASLKAQGALDDDATPS